MNNLYLVIIIPVIIGTMLGMCDIIGTIIREKLINK
jgi:hypothetical protein